MNPSTTYLVRVTAPNFCAGFVTRSGGFMHAAPIIRKLVRQGMSPGDFARWARRQGWVVEWWEVPR